MYSGSDIQSYSFIDRKRLQIHVKLIQFYAIATSAALIDSLFFARYIYLMCNIMHRGDESGWSIKIDILTEVCDISLPCI